LVFASQTFLKSIVFSGINFLADFEWLFDFWDFFMILSIEPSFSLLYTVPAFKIRLDLRLSSEPNGPEFDFLENLRERFRCLRSGFFSVSISRSDLGLERLVRRVL
jgi:hypothetical protein